MAQHSIVREEMLHGEGLVSCRGALLLGLVGQFIFIEYCFLPDVAQEVGR